MMPSADCYTFLVGYDPVTKEGPPKPESRSGLVIRCLNAMAAARAR